MSRAVAETTGWFTPLTWEYVKHFLPEIPLLDESNQPTSGQVHQRSPEFLRLGSCSTDARCTQPEENRRSLPSGLALSNSTAMWINNQKRQVLNVAHLVLGPESEFLHWVEATRALGG